MNKLSRCGGLIVLLCLLAPRAPGQESLRQRELLKKTGIDQRPGAQVPLELHFRNERGEQVRLAELLDGDRPVLLHLMYFRCPMLCNMSANGLIRSLRGLSFDAGEEFEVITVSFDPREGPELAAAAKRTALKRYGRSAAADDWHFLTGQQAQIARLAEAVGFRYHWDDQRGQYAHAAGLIVLTPRGEVSRYLLGVDYAPRDVRLALVEAGEGEIGSISDQVLLLCYQYDPATGKYGLLIQRVLRGAGVATVLVIGVGIGCLLGRERRKRARGEPSTHTPVPTSTP